MSLVKVKAKTSQGFLEQLIERLTAKCKSCTKNYSFAGFTEGVTEVTLITVHKGVLTPTVPITTLAALNEAVAGVACCQGYCQCDTLFTDTATVIDIDSAANIKLSFDGVVVVPTIT